MPRHPSTDASADANDDHEPPQPPATTHDPELIALYEDTTDGPQCTICPARADATDLVTTWLTIDADTVRDLDNWR